MANHMTKQRINYATIYINESELTYRIKHSRKAKYLRLQINPSTGLEVVVPRGCKTEEAEKFIYKKREWILKHLKTVSEKDAYTYSGEKIEITQKYVLFLTRHRVNLHKNILAIESPSGSSDDISVIYNNWLRHRAKSYLPQRTEILASKYGFVIREVRIRNQKTRWGSCSAFGSISLNYRLMKYRFELIDYVIIHELCHLKEMNHSVKFWKLVEKIVPNYKLLKRELRSHS